MSQANRWSKIAVSMKNGDRKKNARPIETGRASDEELCFLKGRALLGRTARIASQTERLLYGNAKTDRRTSAGPCDCNIPHFDHSQR
jgi:hypothetical protein